MTDPPGLRVDFMHCRQWQVSEEHTQLLNVCSGEEIFFTIQREPNLTGEGVSAVFSRAWVRRRRSSRVVFESRY